MPAPSLVSLTVYPIKSLDGHPLRHAVACPGGGLADDRRWRLVDMEGRVINAKRTPLIQAVRALFDLDERWVRLSSSEQATETFPIQPGRQGPCGWLSEALGMPVLLEERADGFPDDHEAPGPTLITTASLVAVAGWFGFAVEEARRRFRSNLEVDGAAAFWEDTLASPANPQSHEGQGREAQGDRLPAVDPYADLPPPEPRSFTLGPVALAATGVCRRCVVPTRTSLTGEPALGFRETFEARRRQSLRRDVATASWHTLYRLGINTRLTGQRREQLILGDTLRVAK